MKLTKKKVFTLALAVCLIATLSMGTLAWFTDDDVAQNDFMIAGSDENADKVFSVDVWEDRDGDGVADDDFAEPDKEGLLYTDIQPGDTVKKNAFVKNTGSYEQYIRVKIIVSHASVWQEAYAAEMVPVTEFVDVNLDEIDGIASTIENGSFVYYLYYTGKLAVGGQKEIFKHAYICEYLDRDQAVTLSNDFNIKVVAEAVQTAHVGENAYEAFKTVGMEVPVNTAFVADAAELIEAVEAKAEYIVLKNDIRMNQAHKIAGENADIYLDHFALATAPGIFAGEYGVHMTGDLNIGGHGTLEINSLNMKVEGTFEKGATKITGQGKVFDANGDEIAII